MKRRKLDMDQADTSSATANTTARTTAVPVQQQNGPEHFIPIRHQTSQPTPLVSPALHVYTPHNHMSTTRTTNNFIKRKRSSFVKAPSDSRSMSDAVSENILTDIEEHFQELIAYIKKLDDDNGNSFLGALSQLQPGQLIEKLTAIENYSTKLGFEEARQMQQGRILDVLSLSTIDAPKPITITMPKHLIAPTPPLANSVATSPDSTPPLITFSSSSSSPSPSPTPPPQLSTIPESQAIAAPQPMAIKQSTRTRNTNTTTTAAISIPNTQAKSAITILPTPAIATLPTGIPVGTHASLSTAVVAVVVQPSATNTAIKTSAKTTTVRARAHTDTNASSTMATAVVSPNINAIPALATVVPAASIATAVLSTATTNTNTNINTNTNTFTSTRSNMSMNVQPASLTMSASPASTDQP